MFTKQQAVEFAKQYQWTAKDAERAFDTIDLKQADDRVLLTAMAAFAGKELINRQRLQAAQKGQVTKKTKYIKEIEQDFAQKISEYDENLKKERSLFVGIIANLYKFAKVFGMKDPWTETLLSQYEEYLSDESKDAA
jgi:hypothetical protein